MADETTDQSNNEQCVNCIPWVLDDQEVHEDFLGLYIIDPTTYESLVKLIKDAMLRMNLTLSNCCGQCYGGASNMSGKNNGVAKQITYRSKSQETHTVVVMH